MKLTWRGNEDSLRQRLPAYEQLVPTYSEIGGTATEQLPAGYHHVFRDNIIGKGPEDFERASIALRGFAMHRRAGLLVAGDEAVIGSTVAFATALGPLAIQFACRVVSVSAQDCRSGFAYGTLPGHPESGEESFMVVRNADDVVRFEIRAFSRPASFLTHIGGPVGRSVQARYTDRYVRALRSLTRASKDL